MPDHRLSFAKALRSSMTDAETRLWLHLRAHRLQGFKFKRQQPIGPYIVDFVCFDARLVIEVDGGQHLDSCSDSARDQWFADNGFRVLRFWNDQVLRETERVLEEILRVVAVPPPLSPHFAKLGSDSMSLPSTQNALSREGRGARKARQ